MLRKGAGASTTGREFTTVHARVLQRRPEIEQAILTRVYSISDPTDVSDPAYLDGLRAAVSTALDHGLAAIESPTDRPPPVPADLLVQARLAARNGVGLDAVLRRYFAGYALLGDFLIEEAETGGLLDGAEMKRLLRSQATLLDRLIAAVTEEYGRESERRFVGSDQRRSERVQRLLRGELVDTSELAYPFEAHHVGLVASGTGASEALRDLATGLDCRLLLVNDDEQTASVWLGSRREPDTENLERLLTAVIPPQVAIAIGEPAFGLAGWRLTHRQAAAALPIARRREARVVRYADVALLASVVQDDLLTTSLRRFYLEPLEGQRDGGEAARKTLLAYFDTGRSVSSTAAALGVTRNTVANRLHAIEEAIGQSLTSCAPELEVALLADQAQPQT